MERGKVLLLTSNQFGTGAEALGFLLIRGFFQTLRKNPQIPGTIIFMNSGVQLLMDDEVVESLQALEEMGVQLLACGTCLDYYVLTDQIKAGTVSNMRDITALLVSKEVITL